MGDEQVNVPRVAQLATIASTRAEHRKGQCLERINHRLSSSLNEGSKWVDVAHLITTYLADWCTIDALTDDGTLNRLAASHIDADKTELLYLLHAEFPINLEGRDPVALALRSGQTERISTAPELWLHDGVTHPEQLAILRQVGMVTYLALPLTAAGRTLGVLSLVTTSKKRLLSATEQNLCHEVSRRVALALDHAELLRNEQRARQRAEDAERRWSFLAKAGEILALSLDYQTTLSTLVNLCVPELGDWCWVDMVNDDKNLERRAIGHQNPMRLHEARALQEKIDARERRASGVGEIVRAGESLIINDVDEETRNATSSSEPDAELIRYIGVRALMSVPIKLRERVVGAMTFAYAETASEYTLEELVLAEELTRRAALALDNARLYGAATEASRMKDEFLATLSHELRTPLNAIVGWTRMLKSGTLDEKTTELAIDTIDRNAQLQTKLIGDLLDISRVITAKLQLNIRSVDMQSVVESAIDTVRLAARAKEIVIDREFDQSLPPLAGDPDRLQQVVWNILANAIKFTPRGGHVLVALRSAANAHQIVVKDTGQGIGSEFLPYVFDRFRQAESSTTRTHGGLGLGLAIVRQLVEMHGGTVLAQSDGFNQGATFTVTLPTTLPLTKLPEKITQDKQSLRLDSLHVLVVDDEPDARELVRAVLEGAGARVRTVSSVREALTELMHAVPDVLLSDIAMPDEDGYTLMSYLQTHGAIRPAASAALTAYARADDRQRSLLAGFDMHLVKPIQPQTLLQAVAALARPRRLSSH